jgi:hypothetical protein
MKPYSTFSLLLEISDSHMTDIDDDSHVTEIDDDSHVTEIDDECSVAVLHVHLLRYVSLCVPSSLSEAVKNYIRNILAVKWL